MLKKIMIFSLAWLSLVAFAGDKIEKKYNHKIAVLTHKYKTAQLKKINSTIATYKALQKKTLKAKDLDGAIRIKKAIDELKEQLKSGDLEVVVTEIKSPTRRRKLRGEYIAFDLAKGTYKSYRKAPSRGWGKEFKTTKLVMRRIPKGTFTMGSPESELGRVGGRETLHKVTLTQDYYIGVFELTQAQYKLITGDSSQAEFDSGSNSLGKVKDKMRPMETVSYNDIRGSSLGANWPTNSQVDSTSMLGKLRAKFGGKLFDLPTEAQWEYACRAGTKTALNSGKKLRSIVIDSKMNKVGWYKGNNTTNGETNGTKVVGRKLPNNWGLYDMHGNAWEWCLDWKDNCGSSAVTDPKGPTSGSNRSLRGGSWPDYARFCRSAGRDGGSPSSGYSSTYGLRLVLPSKAKSLFDGSALYKTHYYKYFPQKCTWKEAKAICESAGGYLACIKNSCENKFVATLTKGAPAWLGGTDEKREGKWRWLDGSRFSYSNWDHRFNEPNGGNRENYLVIGVPYMHDPDHWNDLPNEDIEGWGIKGFVCEWNEKPK